MLDRALSKDTELKKRKILLNESGHLFRFAGGDARKLLNIIELLTQYQSEDPVIIDNEKVTASIQANPMAYDKNGEIHYDIISAFIKSIRGSDPDAAVYWLARMVEGGEEPKSLPVVC